MGAAMGCPQELRLRPTCHGCAVTGVDLTDEYVER